MVCLRAGDNEDICFQFSNKAHFDLHAARIHKFVRSLRRRVLHAQVDNQQYTKEQRALPSK